MKKLFSGAILVAGTLLINGCQSLDSQSILSMAQSTQMATQLSDEQVRDLSKQACAEYDSKSKIAPANSTYTKRLNKIAKSLGYSINGVPVNYKVYITPEMNAWAMANGCVRVYSGLMDKMSDNEIQGVLGHELGHVALGHTKKAMQVAYMSNALQQAVGSTAGKGVLGNVSKQYLAKLSQTLIEAQFSQYQETQADNYSFDFLVKRKINPAGLATAFDKLGGSSSSSLFSSHPPSTARAKNIRQKLQQLQNNK